MIPMILLLTSCSKTEATVTIGPEIFTSVAQTLTAQYTPVAATVTPLPTETATQFIAPTVFATKVTPLATVAVSACDNSVYAGDVTYVDGTTVTPKTKITKTWKFTNTGTCTWTATYKIKFVSGSQMEGTSTAIGKTVKPGESIDVSVDMVTPTTAGTYSGVWMLVNDSGTFFGEYGSIKIVVSTTITPTITGTPGNTPTRTSTPIYIVVTATPKPTDTTAPTAITEVPVKTEPPVATDAGSGG